MKTQFRTHGLRNHKLYRIWSGIIQRCDKTYCINYRDYGGRGIFVCSEWYDFKTFYDWAVSNGWILGLQIDRINVNGNYEPNNCRWVTAKDNARNKRNSKITIKIAKDIRESKDSTNVLMKRYNVCKSTINNIKTKVSWI